MRHPDVKHKMEGFTLQHILPEFTAQEGYMRAVVRDLQEQRNVAVDDVCRPTKSLPQKFAII